jgi:simple sugar transport system permease protein
VKLRRQLVDLLLGLAPIALALAFTTVILWVANAPPVEAYANIWSGATENATKISSVLMAWVPLVLCAAGLLVTFTAGLWNIGVEGQIVVGALFVTWVARNITLPSAALVPLLLLSGMLGGALWGVLCGLLKTHGRVHEIFAGVGLNFVAAALTNFFIFGPWKPADGATMSGTDTFPQAAWLPRLGNLPLIPLAVVAGLVAVAGAYFILRGTIWGLELKAIGRNVRSAFLMGIPTDRHLLLAFALCGALGGLAGAIQSAGVRQRLIPGISAGYGFLALLVVLLSGYRPLLTVPIALFFALIGVGSPRLELRMQLDSSLGGILEAALVLFVLLANGLRRQLPSRES